MIHLTEQCVLNLSVKYFSFGPVRRRRYEQKQEHYFFLKWGHFSTNRSRIRHNRTLCPFFGAYTGRTHILKLKKRSFPLFQLFFDCWLFCSSTLDLIVIRLCISSEYSILLFCILMRLAKY